MISPFHAAPKEGFVVTPAVARDMKNPPFDSASSRFLIVRLSPYRDMEVSMSHLVLFNEIRRAVPTAYIDFAFLPPAPDRIQLDRLSFPWFFGRASAKAPQDFDAILVSCSYTLELVNLSWLLVQCGIPLAFEERCERNDVPLLILGGSGAVTSGAALSLRDGQPIDSLVDAIFFGEGEGAIGAIALEVDAWKGSPAGKRTLLQNLGRDIEGFWPCMEGYSAMRRLHDNRPALLASPLVLNGEHADHVKLAITAGCTGYCAFCLEGWDRRPFQEKSIEDISAVLTELKKASGALDIELFSYNFNMHRSLPQIVPLAARSFMQVSLMSQRLDILAEHPALIDLETAAGKRSFTLGVEGISSRMRRYYHKGIEDWHIQRSAAAIMASGPRELKLFFIISGFEQEQDLLEFKELCEQIHAIREETRRPTRIIVSAGFLVRLPFTPLQYAPLMKNRTTLSHIASRMESLCRQAGFEFRLAAPYGDYWADQLLSIAGSQAHEWLSATCRQQIVYDGVLTKGAAESLDAFLSARSGYDALLDEKAEGFRPDFAFIEKESHWTLLRAHYEQAKTALENNASSGAARASRPRRQHGRAMGSKEEINAFAERMRAIQQAKTFFPFRIVRVQESSDLAWAVPAYRRSYLLRTLAMLAPGAEKAIFFCRELVIPHEWERAFSEAGRSFGLYGLRWYSIHGPHASALEKALMLASNALRTGAGYAACSSILDLEIVPQDCPPQPDSCTLSLSLPSADADRQFSLRNAIEAWLRHEHVTYTVRKENDALHFASSVSKQKAPVRDARLLASDAKGFALSLVVGKNADIADLTKELGEKGLCALPEFKIEQWN